MSFSKTIAPIIIAVFAVYLTIGMTLGVLPGFVKNDLLCGNATVGLVVGLQALATLLTRAYSGRLTDTRGAKTSIARGIVLIISSGIIYMVAVALSRHTMLALALTLIARTIHGISESLLVTGALTWGIGLAGIQRSGKVMTWNGIAMYAGIAAGAPAAIWLKASCGPIYVFATIIPLAVVSLLATQRLEVLPADAAHIRTPFYKVVGLIARQGTALAFASIGFACISSFIALLFASRSWGNPSAAFIAFGGSYILTRIFFASLPDRFGGYKVAIVSLAVEIVGQLLIGWAPGATLAIVGCCLTGTGFSLIFPSLGVLAIQKVAPQMRGTALGAYSAFFDLSLGLAGPVAGIIAGCYQYQAVYFFGAISGVLAILILSVNKNK